MKIWTQLIISALGGGFTVKILDIAYQEIRNKGHKQQTIDKLVDENLDPILKSCDEIVGKIRSLVQADFKPLISMQNDIGSVRFVGTDEGDLLFLFANFWARVEILKRQTIALDLSSHEKGKILFSYFNCLESRKIRLVDRSVQRAIGETLIVDKDMSQTKLFVNFSNQFEIDPLTRRWFSQLHNIFLRIKHTSERQKLLQYAVVLHSMIDELDPHHRVTKDRPSWPNKLTERTRKGLRYRVFGVYLDFVKNPEKYTVPNRKKR